MCRVCLTEDDYIYDEEYEEHKTQSYDEEYRQADYQQRYRDYKNN